MESTEHPQTETWRPVCGTPHYEVSDLGRVRSLARTVTRSDGRSRRFPSVLLSAATHPNAPHPRVNVHGKTRTVHSLVCRAFHGEPKPGQEVRHLNGIPSDNRASNLAWGDKHDQADDDKRNGVGKAFHPACSRGHEFIPQNLRQSELANNVRACLSCKRAHDLRRSGDLRDVQVIADELFEALR